MIQFNTKNKSFLKMYYILKEMGIKNNSFFLQLLDEDLLYIDPLDEETLTEEQKIRIHIEISRNPWYFFREIVKIPMTDIKLDFELHRGTLAILWVLLNDLKSYVILPRQCYKSYTACCFYTWLMYWGSKNFSGVFFAQNEYLVTQNLSRVKDVRDSLPKYLNLKTNADTDNSRTLIFKTESFKNTLVVKAPGTNEDTANNVGRGQSTMGQWWDEFPFIPYVNIQYGAAIPAFSTVSQMAERNGSHNHILITTTAGNKKTKNGKWAYDFLNSCAPFTELLYDESAIIDENGDLIGFNKNIIRDYIANNNSGQPFLRIEYQWYELSKPVTYLDDMRKLCGGMDEFNRGVLNIWTDSNEDHPLGQERVQGLYEFLKEPKRVLMVDKIYVLKLYKDQDYLKAHSKHIVFGMDCGGNTRRDFSTLVGVDVTTYEVVATLRVNQYSIVRFAKAISYILTYLFPRSTLIVERNYTGIVVKEIISENIGSDRMYKDEKGEIGIHLLSDLRDLLFENVLRVSVVEYGNKIYDKTIVDEIATLKSKPNGRIDHSGKDSHDDTLIAYLYCMWFIMFCKTKGRYIDRILFGSMLEKKLSEDELNKMRKEDDEYKTYRSLYNLTENIDDITHSDITSNENIRKKIETAIDNSLDYKKVTNNKQLTGDFILDFDDEPVLKEGEISINPTRDNLSYEYSENLDIDDPEKIEKVAEDIRDKSNDPQNNLFSINFKI